MYVCVCTPVCVHMCVRVFCVCVCVCVCVRTRACVYRSMCARERACVRAHVRVQVTQIKCRLMQTNIERTLRHLFKNSVWRIDLESERRQNL